MASEVKPLSAEELEQHAQSVHLPGVDANSIQMTVAASVVAAIDRLTEATNRLAGIVEGEKGWLEAIEQNTRPKR